MNTYTIRRRNGWKTVQEIESTAEVAVRIADEQMPDEVRWIRSYVIDEEDGSLGTVCIYQATGPEAIREHSRRVGMPANEINRVATTVIMRDDPVDITRAA